MPITTRPRLVVSVDHPLDILTACEFGTTIDGRLEDQWHELADGIDLLRDSPDEPVIGFRVFRLSERGPEAFDIDELWSGEHFDAPVLGLFDVPAGAVITAARDRYRNNGTFNRYLFGLATHAKGEEAVRAWRQCLEAGELMAHYGLGYSLLEIGCPREAYHHLRCYTEIAPQLPWAWRYFGAAAEAIGELAEARAAYRRALALSAEHGEETDAGDLLAAMADGTPTPERSGVKLLLWGDELAPGRRRIESLASGLAAGLVNPGALNDAVAVVEFEGCTVLACAAGDGDPVTSRVALRALLAALRNVPDVVETAIEEPEILWEQVRLALAGPAELHGSEGGGVSLTLAVVCCDAVIWSAVGATQLFFVTPDGFDIIDEPEPTSLEPLEWGASEDDLAAGLRTAGYLIDDLGAVLVHSNAADVFDALGQVGDPEIPGDLRLGVLLSSGEGPAAAALMQV